jgi:hypothetical protein
VLKRLADDLTARFGRGFSRFNLGRFRQFYLAAPADQIRATLSLKSSGSQIRATPSLVSHGPGNRQTPSGKSLPTQRSQAATPDGDIVQTASALSSLSLPLADLARAFPLPWSHYVLLISRSRSPEAFAFYQTEALRGGWSVRQLQRQMDSQFYERTALSRSKATMLVKGAKAQPGGDHTPFPDSDSSSIHPARVQDPDPPGAARPPVRHAHSTGAHGGERASGSAQTGQRERSR